MNVRTKVTQSLVVKLKLTNVVESNSNSPPGTNIEYRADFISITLRLFFQRVEGIALSFLVSRIMNILKCTQIQCLCPLLRTLAVTGITATTTMRQQNK